MRAHELFEAIKKKAVSHLSDEEKYNLAKFMNSWLRGDYMRRPKAPEIAKNWRLIHSLFPPKFPQQTARLYRLVTLPIKYATMTEFNIQPGRGPICSWSKTLVGIDCVAGVAMDFYDGDLHKTTRLAVVADIPVSNVLATHTSMRDCFMALTHDYWDKHPEIHGTEMRKCKYTGKEELYSTYENEGWTDEDWDMNDVGALQDLMNRPGGNLRQYECIVECPNEMSVRVVRVYREGEHHHRYGHDDPHNY